MTDADRNTRVEGRPAPEYGEYAPPGWVNPVEPPPVDSDATPAAPAPTRPAGSTGAQDPATRRQGTPGPFPPKARQRFDAPPPTGAPVPGPPPAPGSSVAPGTPLATMRRAAFNRFATVFLAVLGGYDVVSSAFDAKSFSGRYVSEFTRLGYLEGTFQSAATLDAVALVAAIASVPLYLVALVVALRRLRVGRRSWLFLLVPGVAVNIVLGLIVVGVVMADPSFTGAV